MSDLKLTTVRMRFAGLICSVGLVDCHFEHVTPGGTGVIHAMNIWVQVLWQVSK